jgi:uncharacterized protein YkwD
MKNTMKTRYFLALLGSLFPLLGTTSCVAPTKLKVAAYSPDQILASCVFDQVNGYRKNKGSGPLKGHPGLNNLAVRHSEYMRRNRGKFDLYGKNVSHMGSEGRSLAAMRIYHFTSISENVAAARKAGSDSASAANLVVLWKNSPNHEAAMADPEYTHTGVGIVTDSDGTIFATQLFGTMTTSQLSTRERFNAF